MILTDDKHNTWLVLTKYKMLSDRVNDLRTKAWLELPPTDDVQTSLDEAEQELNKLKAWIDLNFEMKKLD